MAERDDRSIDEMLDELDRAGSRRLSRRTVVAMGTAAAFTGALPWNAAAARRRRAVASAGSATPKDTLVIAAPGTPSTLDPEFDVNIQTTDAIGMLYDHMLQFAKITDPEDPDVRRVDISLKLGEKGRVNGWNLVPELATRLEISDGGRRATYHLRRGVKSNWGNELTAETVKWNWDRRFALKAIGGFYTGVLQLEGPDAVRVDGRYAVSFHTAKPQPLWAPISPNLYIPVFDAVKLKEQEKAGDKWGVKFLKKNSAGFGPYEITELTHGQQAVFKARKDYWGKPPALKTVVYKDVPSSPDRVALISRGDVDVAQYLRPRELKQLQKTKGVKVHAIEATQETWIELNAKFKPFDNVLVRQAMNYAFPFEDILKAVYFGFGRRLGTGIPTLYPFATEKFFDYQYDLDKAKALLAKAGLAKGFSSSLSYNAGVPEQEDIETLYRTSLAKVGVKIELEKLPQGTFYDFVSKRSKPMIFYTDAPWCPDPGYSNYLYFHKDSFVNYSNYKNARVSSMIDQGLQTLDQAKRKRLYTQVQQTYMKEAPWVFVVRPDQHLVTRDNVHGWVYYTSNHVQFQDFRKT